MPVIIATLDTEQGEFRWFRYSLSTQPGHDTIVSATTPYALDTTCIMYNWTGLHGALDRTRGLISMMVSILVFTGHDVHLTLSILVKPFDAPTRALTPLMDVRHGHVRHGHVPDVPRPAVRSSSVPICGKPNLPHGHTVLSRSLCSAVQQPLLGGLAALPLSLPLSPSLCCWRSSLVLVHRSQLLNLPLLLT